MIDIADPVKVRGRKHPDRAYRHRFLRTFKHHHLSVADVLGNEPDLDDVGLRIGLRESMPCRKNRCQQQSGKSLNELHRVSSVSHVRRT